MRANRHAELKLTAEQLRGLAAQNVAELLREYGYDKATEIVDSIRTAFGNARLGEDQPADDDTASGTPAADDDGDTSLFRKRLGRVGDSGETPSLFDRRKPRRTRIGGAR